MSQIVVIDTRTIRSSHFICLLLVLFSRDHFVWVTKFKCYDSWFTPLIYYRFTDISSIYAAIRYLLKTTESKVSIDLYFASLNSVRSSSINMCTLHSAHTHRKVCDGYRTGVCLRWACPVEACKFEMETKLNLELIKNQCDCYHFVLVHVKAQASSNEKFQLYSSILRFASQHQPFYHIKHTYKPRELVCAVWTGVECRTSIKSIDFLCTLVLSHCMTHTYIEENHSFCYSLSVMAYVDLLIALWNHLSCIDFELYLYAYRMFKLLSSMCYPVFGDHRMDRVKLSSSSKSIDCPSRWKKNENSLI